jgi:hypothetical protein
MKKAFSIRFGSSLLAAAGVAIASAALTAAPAVANTLEVNLSDVTNSDTANYPTVKVTLDDTTNAGKITVKVNVVPGSTGYTGDLRGVYFNLPNISGLKIEAVSGGPLTNISTDGNFKSFSPSADLQGVKTSFNAGVEVGSQGIAGGDDYRTTTFTISGTGLTLGAFTSQTVGARMMSVGDPNGSRDLSSKTAGTTPTTVTVTNPTNTNSTTIGGTTGGTNVGGTTGDNLGGTTGSTLGGTTGGTTDGVTDGTTGSNTAGVTGGTTDGNTGETTDGNTGDSTDGATDGTENEGSNIGKVTPVYEQEVAPRKIPEPSTVGALLLTGFAVLCCGKGRKQVSQ